jgi:hypothetical protein
MIWMIPVASIDPNQLVEHNRNARKDIAVKARGHVSKFDTCQAIHNQQIPIFTH